MIPFQQQFSKTYSIYFFLTVLLCFIHTIVHPLDRLNYIMPQAMIKKFNDGTLSVLRVKYKPEYMKKPANEKIIPPSKWFSLRVYTSQFMVFIWVFCHM